MRSSVAFLLAFLTAVVNAHFRLQFPQPRGPFDAAKEVGFCDGYTTPAANRTRFPLSGGNLTLNFNHGDTWSVGIFVSTSQNPTTFDEFALNNGFASSTKAGNYCLPLDFSKSNVTGLSDGQNITIQLVWNGGDGPLYQCADLTLGSDVNTSSMECVNKTLTLTSSSASSPSSTSTPSSASTPIAKSITYLVGLIALSGLLLL